MAEIIKHTTTYKLCIRVINNKVYETKEDLMIKLDVFLVGNRITKDEYEELVKLLDDKEKEVVK